MSPSASVHSAVEPAESPLTPESWGKLGMWIFLAGDAVGFGVLLASYGGMRGTSAHRPGPYHVLRGKPTPPLTLLPVCSGVTNGQALEWLGEGGPDERAGSTGTSSTSSGSWCSPSCISSEGGRGDGGRRAQAPQLHGDLLVPRDPHRGRDRGDLRAVAEGDDRRPPVLARARQGGARRDVLHAPPFRDAHAGPGRDHAAHDRDAPRVPAPPGRPRRREAHGGREGRRERAPEALSGAGEEFPGGPWRPSVESSARGVPSGGRRASCVPAAAGARCSEGPSGWRPPARSAVSPSSEPRATSSARSTSTTR